MITLRWDKIKWSGRAYHIIGGQLYRNQIKHLYNKDKNKQYKEAVKKMRDPENPRKFNLNRDYTMVDVFNIIQPKDLWRIGQCGKKTRFEILDVYKDLGFEFDARNYTQYL